MYAITLSFMVGVLQMAFGFLKLGIIFNYFSHTIMVAIVTGVGILIINTTGWQFSGLNDDCTRTD